MRDLKRLSIIILVFALGACAKPSAKQEAPAASRVAAAPAPAAQNEAVAADRVGGGSGGKMGVKRSRKKSGLYGLKGPGRARPVLARKAVAKSGVLKALSEGGEQDEMQTPTRSWFPETFLFRPLVVTDGRGKASVDVRVPDRLTTWRVLALAHSRQGQQAGDVSSFLGTLPVYVEPVVPPVLRSGDVLRLPINLVNTTQSPVQAKLRTEVEGLSLQGGSYDVALGPAASAVRYATITAGAPTQAKLFAKLAGNDAVLRTIEIVPTGRPIRQTVKGTLASPRDVKLRRAPAGDATLGRVRLQVFPGALALLRSELSSAGGRAYTVADSAFALLLAGKAPGLMRALGAAPTAEKEAKAEAAALRDLTMLVTQRVLRQARVLTVSSASLLAEAAGAHPDNPILERLAKRAVSTIVEKQSPDGTCGGASGWTLQRLLVSTAECVRATPGEKKVAARAVLAMARHEKRVEDPYTAAALLAAGLAQGKVAERLRKLVLAAIVKRLDGSKAIKLPRGVVRADGQRPTVVEATALAILALEGVKGAPLPDLGATIMAGYSPEYGWGDGRANLVCMKAALKVFREPMPPKIRVVLERDGQKVAEGALTRARLRETIVLEAAAGAAPAAGTKASWKVIADPPVAGLGFALTLTDWVPWEKKKGRGGVELSIQPPPALAVGQRGTLAVRAVVPGGRSLKVRLALPAGVQADRKQLDKLVRQGVLRRYKVTDAEVTLFSPPMPAAKVFSAPVHVVPTLAGRLHSGAASLEVGGVTVFEPPVVWVVK